MKWNHGDLYRAVLAKYGDQYAKGLKPIIYSFPWKFRIAEYHIREAQNAFNRKLADDEVQARVKLLEAMFNGLGDMEKDQIGKLLLENEAHIIAYAQSAHSVADNLASIIYYSINFKKEFNGFKFHNNYHLSHIKNELQKKQMYGDIVKKLDNLLTSDEFCYLSAFTNTIKHRQLLDHSLSIALISTERHGLVFNKFRYKNHTYAAKKANDFVDSDYYKLKKLYLEIGISINNVLIPSP